MKITVLDGVVENPGDLSWNGLERLGELTVYDRTSMTDEDEIVERIGNAEVVITNKTPLGRAVLERCPSIRFISVLATGYNVVDCDCAKERGIPVSNVPAYGTDVVAQFAIALLLEICHHVGAHSEAVRQGRWENCPDWCFWDYPLIELAGKTMGIIGFGRIGQKTGTIAKALGMRILAFSPHESETGRKIWRVCGSGYAAGRVGCDFPALPPVSGDERNHQPGDHCENEGWRDSSEQQPGTADQSSRIWRMP